MRTLLAVVGVVLLWTGLGGAAGAEEKSAGQSPSAAELKVLYERKACAYCHGADGRTPRFDTIPIIAGQMPRYSYHVLKAYKSGERQGVGANMHTDVNDLTSDEEMRLLAGYIATLR